MWDILAKGGIAMIPIGICSVVALAIIIERLWVLRRNRILPHALMVRVESLVREGHRLEAMDACIAANCSLGNILLSGLNRAGERRSVIKEAIEETGRHEAVYLERYLNLLSAIVSLTPLLGLLGTVLGMIEVFSAISGGSGANPVSLAHGIGEALVATAAGLTVAIPSLAMYHFFEGQVDRYVTEMEQFALVLIEHIKSGH